jgi:hypothetical protein
MNSTSSTQKNDQIGRKRVRTAANNNEDSRGESGDEDMAITNPSLQVQGQTSLKRFFGGGGSNTNNNKDGSASEALGSQSSPNKPTQGSNHKHYMFKIKRHPKSLYKDGVSTIRYLQDQSQSIF